MGVFETRKHYTNYFKDITNFKDYRMRMLNSDGLFIVLEAINTPIDD
nr:hypothetical protein [Aequorivita sp. S2608]MDS1298834.1 hypothetical protein [Aequorivita sp. S2608]